MLVIGRHEFGAEATQNLVHKIRVVGAAARFPASVHVYVGGAPAQGVDFLARTYGAFPWIVLLVLVLAYLVLLRAFCSVLLPLMAVLLDAVSVTATYGLLVVVFRFGVGADVLGLYRVPQIEGVALSSFSPCCSVSPWTTRSSSSPACGSRGTPRRTTSSPSGDGLTHTGRVVSAAALIMVGALSGLVAGHVAGLQELGVGLALGVLLDATVVRGLLMPSLMALFGRWNWWLPAPLGGVHRPPLTAQPAGPIGELTNERST